MIKKVTIILVIILVLAIAGKVLYDNFDGIFQLPSGKDANDNSVWQYEIHDGKTVITAYKGKAPVLTVPEELDGYPVDEIGDDVFSGNTRIKEITIPEGVRTIGEWAFRNCSSLEAVMIPESVTEIAAEAFLSCPEMTMYAEPGSYAESFACKHRITLGRKANI